MYEIKFVLKNLPIILKVCSTRTVSDKVYFSQETQFAVAMVSNTLSNNDPQFVNIDVTLMVDEDMGKKCFLYKKKNYLQKAYLAILFSYLTTYIFSYPFYIMIIIKSIRFQQI